MNQAIKIFFAILLCFWLQSAIASDGIIYKTASGIRFINGGISEEQADDIRRTAKKFSLQVLFSGGSVGGWLTDVSIVILNEKGKTVFSKKQSGPILFLIYLMVITKLLAVTIQKSNPFYLHFLPENTNVSS
jgi:hypothetical protein